ncbi:hypothetical protein [Luteolibacter sp. LG18]|uniref:hypothetical protein n=1 Tax=Luteolibacter sp. LG18 TaxID=2819286 RepID=UPI0030C76CC0
MSKKANRFEQSSGWTCRPGGSARKGSTSKPNRSDVSAGSARMADGGGPGPSVVMKKERPLAQFRLWRADGKLGKQVRCPICKHPVSTDNFDRHVRRTH